jgi:hypothetical protein
MRTGLLILLAGPLLLLAGACSDPLPTAPQQALFSTGGEMVAYEPILLEGGSGSATAISDDGIIVGLLGGGSARFMAVRWVTNGTAVTGPDTLGALPAPFHEAFEQRPSAINARGTIVGSATRLGGAQGAWIYDGEMKLLRGVPAGMIGSNAEDINDAGIVVGYINLNLHASDGTVTQVYRGAVWADAAAEPLLLPPLPGHDVTMAGAISGDGLVTGSSRPFSPDVEHVTWRVDARGELISGPDRMEPGFSPRAVNNAGDIAGTRTSSGGGHAALMRAGTILSLAPLAGGEDGEARGVAGVGVDGVVHVVGRSGSRAALWTVDRNGAVRAPVELRPPSGPFSGADAGSVNARGWIAGNSAPRNGGGVRPTLWLPQPEDGGGACTHPKGKCK